MKVSIEAGDTITLYFSEAMDTSIEEFDITVSNDDSSVITIKSAVGEDVGKIFATITATNQKYNSHENDAMTFNPSTGVWNQDKTQLVITLGDLADGTPNPDVQDEGTCSIVAGSLAKDLVGNPANPNPVTGASGGF